MIRFSTSNGTYLSIPGNAPDDLELAKALIPMSIDHEQRIIAEKAKQLCTAINNVAALSEAHHDD